MFTCMSDERYDQTIQFRVGREKEATELLDNIMLGLTEMLRRSLTDEDKITVYEMYDEGRIEKGVARILLGEELDHIEEERDAFQEAMERDTSSFLT